MRKLICLISTEGKSPEQVADEAWKAYQKYRKVESKVQENFSKPKEPLGSSKKESTEDAQDEKGEWEVLVRLPQDVDEPPKPPAKPLK